MIYVFFMHCLSIVDKMLEVQPKNDSLTEEPWTKLADVQFIMHNVLLLIVWEPLVTNTNKQGLQNNNKLWLTPYSFDWAHAHDVLVH